MVDRLTERVAGVRCIEFRPEQGNKPVAAMEAVWTRAIEVDEQGQPLGLRQYFDELMAVRTTEIDGAKSAELDQGCPPLKVFSNSAKKLVWGRVREEAGKSGRSDSPSNW